MSTQLRFGSNFNLVRVQIVELIYKPKKSSRSQAKSRARNYRSRSRSSNIQKEKKDTDKKESFNPLQYVHSYTKKINQI